MLLFIVLILSVVGLIWWYLQKVSSDISQIDWDWDDDEIL